MNVATDMVVDLEEVTPGTFSIFPVKPKDGTHSITIPKDDPGHNYASWIWDVTPICVGSHNLILSAEDVKGHRRNAFISITVTTVNPELENNAAMEAAKAAQNATAVVREDVTTTTTTVTTTTVPSENATTTTVRVENVTTTKTTTVSAAENNTTVPAAENQPPDSRASSL